ncbi:uncharacterized protein LOC135346389 [Halichondria panicea]|uniref:uncharacterized protein LOC135346389 n=1 Tax=Halichondria panicea TaxID=6063 RepID=UPI00312B95EF
MKRLGAVVFYWLALILRINATFLVSDERPCPMERVTFTCTAPGALLRWSPSDVASNIDVDSEFTPLNMPEMPVPGYTVTLTAFDDTGLTSTFSRVAENGVMVTCLDPPNDVIGSATVQLAGPPSSPQGFSHSVESRSVNEVSVTVGWDPPTETGGRDDLTYTVTVLPLAQLSAIVLTSTSATVTAQYNVDYTVSVVATNCAGNSTTAEYNFRIAPPTRCTVPLSPPKNGTISDHSAPALPATQVTFQCDNGLFPKGIMTAVCLATGEWDKNPGEIVCRNETIFCVLPAPPLNGTLLNTNSLNTNVIEGSIITFRCDPGFSSLVGAATVTTCNNSGLWDPDPALLECIYIFPPSTLPTLSTEEAVSVSVVVTAVVFIVIGFLAGLLVTHICSRKKAVYSPATKEKANVRPTVPPGPLYEEVLPKEEIELNTNQAYGPVGL